MNNTAPKVAPKSAPLALVCSCGHNGRRGAHKKTCQRHLVRGFTVANDLVQAWLPNSEMAPEHPDDYKRVATALSRGWGRSLTQTLTKGLVLQGLTFEAAVLLGNRAVKERWIRFESGVWTLSPKA